MPSAGNLGEPTGKSLAEMAAETERRHDSQRREDEKDMEIGGERRRNQREREQEEIGGNIEGGVLPLVKQTSRLNMPRPQNVAVSLHSTSTRARPRHFLWKNIAHHHATDRLGLIAAESIVEVLALCPLLGVGLLLLASTVAARALGAGVSHRGACVPCGRASLRAGILSCALSSVSELFLARIKSTSHSPPY